MFIKYQTVRNTVVGTATAIVGGIAAFFGLQGDSGKTTRHYDSHATSAVTQSHSNHSHSPVSTSPNTQTTVQETVVVEDPITVTAESDNFDLHTNSLNETTARTTPSRPTKEQLYASAMKIAIAKASRSGKAKDVLGPSSPWKLNLYDDDKDGQWDRGKLDTNRDEVDDEKWNFKEGRWEKDGGRLVWSGSDWKLESSDNEAKANVATKSKPAMSNAERYAAAMKIAMAKASPTGKGKDVLGPASPWKLNLYDDDKDGQWDRGKLDYDRDEVDDEKWNFKKGRWEKDGGSTIWTGKGWSNQASLNAAATKQAPPTDAKTARYRQAMAIATRRAPSSKGKDVLGSSSPWKLNLYDDNKDGQWDRAKLDYDRDEVDDEKWNFKKGRWEKDGGATIWDGSNWKPSGK